MPVESTEPQSPTGTNGATDPAVVSIAPPSQELPLGHSTENQAKSPDVDVPVRLSNRFWGLSRGDAIFSLTVGVVLLALSLVHWARLSGWGVRPVEVHRLPEREFDYRLDINRATWVEWMQLDGIGEPTARRIVADREEHGPFPSIDDLRRIRGIGAKTLESLRPRLICESCEH